MTARSVSTIIALFALVLAVYEVVATISGSHQNQDNGTVSAHSLWIIGAYGALAVLVALSTAAAGVWAAREPTTLRVWGLVAMVVLALAAALVWLGKAADYTGS